MIEASDTHGVIAKEIAFALNLDEDRMLYRILEKLLEMNTVNNGMYSICRHFEFEGRQRRYRYFTFKSYMKVYEKKDVVLPSLPEIPMNNLKCSEKNPLVANSPKKTPVRRTRKTTADQPKKNVSNILPEPIQDMQPEIQANAQVEAPMAVDEQSVAPTEVPQSTQEQDVMQVEAIQIETVAQLADQQVKAPLFNNVPKKRRQTDIKDFFGISKKKEEQPKITSINPPENKKARTQTEDNASRSPSESPEMLSPVIVIPNSPIIKKTAPIPTSTSTPTPIDTPISLDTPAPVDTSASVDASTPIITENIYHPVLQVQTSRARKKRTKVSAESVSESNSFKTFNHYNQTKNRYSDQRAAVIKLFLAEQPMIELSKKFRDQYQNRLYEMYGASNHTICMKTLRRTAEVLGKKGELQYATVQCGLLNGAVVEKKVIVRNDIDLEGSEYKSFANHVKGRHTIQRVGYTTPHYEKITIPVERLDQRLARMRASLEELVASGDVVKAAALEKQIEQLSANFEKCRTEETKTFNSSWMITAVQYGWIFARMLRVKRFHQFLFDLLHQPNDINGINKEEMSITSMCLVSKMTLELLCETIGITKPDATFKQYFKDVKDLSITLDELPGTVSSHLFSVHTYFKKKLRSLLHHLEYLGLVSACHINLGMHDSTAPTHSTIASRYILHKHVQVRDFRRINPPIFREFVLETKADVLMYWNDLEYVYRTRPDVSDDQLAPPSTNVIEKEVLASLTSSKGWSSPSIYNKHQRKILNSYVDKVTSTTPFDNDRLIQEIAEDINSTAPKVRGYYRKVQDALDLRLETKRKKQIHSKIVPLKRRAKGKPRIDMYGGRRVVHLDSRKLVTNSIRNQSYFKKLAPLSKGSTNGNSALYMDDLSDIPELTTGDDLARSRTSSRVPWTAQDDEMLLYAGAILKHRGRKSRFKWAAITQVINRPSINCQRRFGTLSHNPVFNEQLADLIGKWDKIYKEGIVNGSIEDKNPYDIVNFDLLGYLTYFLQRLSQNTE